MTQRTRRRGEFYITPRGQELEALKHDDPFEVPDACTCGSTHRVLNNAGRIFCRRCGKSHGERPAPRTLFGTFTITTVSHDFYAKPPRESAIEDYLDALTEP